MNFSAIFIKRPVATILLMVGIGLFGVIAYFALPVSDLPNVDFPTISVSAGLPGADPTTMASSVATPLERQFTTIAGVDSMTSSNSLGSTNITMQFDLSREIDGAAVDVQTAISAAMPLLPPGMPSPPSFRKVNPSDGPIMFFALTSSAIPKSQLDEIAQTVIGQRISSIDGVAQVNIMGSQKYAVRVQVDPEKLATRGIGINEVADAIRNWNVNTPTGTLWGANRAYAIQANGQLKNAEDYKSLIVAWRNNAPVRLSELGIVRDGSEDERTMAWNFNADKTFVQGINLMVMRQPGSNIIKVNDAVRKVLPEIRKQLPPTVDLSIRSDRSKNIREAFADIQVTLLLTLFLVIMVIFLFLRKASATIIPTLALPISLVGTFAVMYVLDYSLDNLSMMAIILSVGFVVDDAIVMLENIVRHIELGESPMEAALKGSREIWFTLVSMTISLAAVFIPILFMGGVMGRLFREFAVTITVAVLISGFVSVTLTPMLASRILRPHSTKPENIFGRMIEAPLTFATRMYELSLGWVVQHHFVMVIVFFGMFAATVKLMDIVPKGFIPDVDTDQIFVNTEMAQGTSYEAMRVYQQRINQVLAQDPDIDTFLSSVGGGMGGPGGGGGNTGRLFVQLRPLKQRKASAAEIANRLRPKLAAIVGVRAVPTLPPAIRIGGRGSNSSYQVTLQAPDTAQLYREGQKFEREVAKLPSVLDINSDIQMRSPRVRIDIDRDKAASFNLDAQIIEQAIYNGYGTSFASTIYAPNNQYRVMLEVTPRYQTFSDMISRLYLKSGDGRLIPLDAVTTRTEDAGPQSINHSGQLPSVTVSFNLKPGIALGQAVEEITELAKEKLPSTISIGFAGTAKAFQDSLSNMTTLLIVAILVVYIVLGVLYESFIHPLTILSGLPSAAFGALFTLMLTGVELNLYAFVGLILLIGLVKKNAIMQIDFALAAQRTEGMSASQAIFKGCVTRFRPIMMTTAASLLGAIPIATGYGAGGEARRPLGMVIIGGLIFSQAITLYLTPVVYVYLDHFQTFLNRRSKPKQALGAPTLGEAHS